MATNPETLNTDLILRMLREETSLKIGEGYEFILHLTFLWKVNISREEELYAPCKWGLEAKCLTHFGMMATRRFYTIDEAILWCVNEFNDNPTVRNPYKSIEQCFPYKKY